MKVTHLALHSSETRTPAEDCHEMPVQWGMFRPAPALGRSLRLVLRYERPQATNASRPAEVTRHDKQELLRPEPHAATATQNDPAVDEPPRTTTVSPNPPHRPVDPIPSDPPAPQTELKAIRFYLELSSPVVDAPSIGPRTAERLAAIDINTIGDLLRAHPQDTADRLAYRRVNADTISLWQQQARMVCQIPGIRGHDAQLLIACGFTDAKALGHMDPDDVLAVVGPFVATQQGQRILRSAKKPDLEEVTNWVTWATHTRRLDAA